MVTCCSRDGFARSSMKKNSLLEKGASEPLFNVLYVLFCCNTFTCPILTYFFITLFKGNKNMRQFGVAHEI